ncbi:Glycerate dehydrogenase [Thiorhodovibrio winogradskyi]|uniref:Glycerate dehydrogenase n=1 Tax=Thiorhodovibrio winogradskyi TaxID=77007 RepID=A0ABZ0S5Y3_9GAMM|nr:NAD(P)-dependent oxidoreductase [Thiorhodovibrio winogradskyi]
MNLLYIGVCREHLENHYPLYHPGQFMASHFSAEELIARVRDDNIDVLMVDVIHLAFDRALLRQLRGQIRQINFLYQSVSSLVDLEEAHHCGILVTKLPDDVYCNEVAEFVIAQLLCACKGMIKFDASMRGGTWNQAITTNQSLRGKTLGVVGFGHIGRRIIQLCSTWDMRLLVSKRDCSNHPMTDNATCVELQVLLEESDFVALAVPLTQETRGLLNSENIERMKHNAILINVSRGDIVDESAVSNALLTGRLGYYCADVFSQEPLAQGHPFLSNESTILSPHVAWSTEGTLKKSFHIWSNQVLPTGRDAS